MKRSWMNLRVMCVAAMLCAAGCGPAGDDAPKSQQQPMTKQAARQLARQQQQDPSGDADPNSGGDPATGQDVCAEQGWYGDGECDEFCDSPDPDCQSCRSDSQCAAAEVCVNHSCLPTSSCTSDADCAIGLVCDSGACGLPAPVADADGDGILDTVDNCPNTPNPDQADTNGDGLGDACAQVDPNTCTTDADCGPSGGCVRGRCESLGPGDTDTDGDGTPDAVDNCPRTPNADQLDSNSDGVGDACSQPPVVSCSTDAECSRGQVCVSGVCEDPTSTGDDLDGDGILDTVDNCPNTPNPDQADTNGDGVGDACSINASAWYCTQDDECPTNVPLCLDNICRASTATTDDLDGDGVLNSSDNCRDVPNPSQEDTNGDGVGDACTLPTPAYCRTDAECAVGQVCVNTMCATP